jgi:predicted nucleic acid-binding protein
MATIVRYLADSSAIHRYPQVEVAARLDPLVILGLVATCAIVDLQLFYAAGDHAEKARLAALRRTAFPLLDTRDADLNRAMRIQAALAERGQHWIAWPCLVIAAVAERHRVILLHDDADYDHITAITGQEAEWVLPKGE